MRKLAYLVTILLALVGGALLAGLSSGPSGFGQTWIHIHMRVVQHQLASLSHHLALYKQSHGRYPTNDEGLPALDNFKARFPVDFPEDEETLRKVAGNLYDPNYRMSMRYLGSLEESGELPKNAEEFRQLALWPKLRDLPKREATTPPTVDLAIAKDGEVFLITHSGVMTPWLVPYIYENRNGLDQSKFAGSLVEKDPARQYSVEVDKGVYVYAVGGQQLVRRLNEYWWLDNGQKFVGAGFLFVALILFIWLNVKKQSPVRKTAVALVLSAGTGLLLNSVKMSCYAMGSLFRPSDPAIVSRQRELLDQYYRQGVIAEPTYKKALEGLEPPKQNS